MHRLERSYGTFRLLSLVTKNLFVNASSLTRTIDQELVYGSVSIINSTVVLR